MKKVINTRLLPVWVCFIFSVTCLVMIFSLSTNGIFLYIGNPTHGIPHYLFICLFVILTCVSGIYLVHSKLKDKGITAIAMIGSFFILAYTFMYGALSLETVYTTFSSPNNQAHFLVAERATGDVYQLSKTKLFMKHLVDIQTDDEFKPFDNMDYQLEWKDNNELVIKYGFSHSLFPKKYREIKVTYSSLE